MTNRRGFGFIGIIFFVLGMSSAGAMPPDPPQGKATELYRLVGGDRLVEQAANAMLVTVRANPQLAPYEDVIKAWFTKVLSGGELEAEMIRLYAETFTEEELGELIAFYHSPVGQKALAKLPMLMQRGAELGSQLAKQHSAELEEMIETRRKELEAKGKASP